MKTFLNLSVLAALLLFPARTRAAVDFSYVSGDTYTASWTGSQTIADNNASGVAYGLNFDFGGGEQIASLSVSFTISGGYNGDLYAYLSHGDGLVVLLNRIGRTTGNADGSDTSGFTTTFKLTSTALNDVHAATGAAATPLGGEYAPDGRAISPYSSEAAFAAASRNATFDSLLGDNPNGSWTLFFSDASAGFAGTLTGWEVSLEAVLNPVPEPTTWALIGFGVIFGAAQLRRLLRTRLVR